MKILNPSLLLSLLLAGCGTYYDPVDRYALGLRFFDRGQFDRAAHEWKPLVEKADPDAQFRYGWLLWTNVLGPNREPEAIELFRKAADQGQAKALVILGDLYYQSPNNVLWQVKSPPFPKDIGKALTFYLKADRMARYSGEKAMASTVLPKIKSEVSAQMMQAVEMEAQNWKPTIVGREPRKLL